MDVIPLLLPLFVLPGWQALDPMPATLDEGILTLDGQIGTGREVQDGDLVTAHLTLSADGTRVIDTVRRGLPYSFAFDGTRGASAIVQAVRGMRRGGSRVVFLPSDRLGKWQSSLVPPGSDLVLTLKLVSSRSLGIAKVNSNDAERAQRAMEISRAARDHGSTRAKDPL